MTSSDAKSIIKGFTPDCSRNEIRDAWQLLVNTGEVWDMGKHYSELAACQIAAGTLERNAA